MSSISSKIAYPIIIAGFFIITAFIGLNYQSLTLNSLTTIVFLIIYVFFFGFAAGQNLASPIRKLLQRADSLSKGDLKSRFYSKDKDELGELAKAFNKIAEEFEQAKVESEITENSVDIKVKARTQGLEETIYALEQKVKNRTAELQKALGDLEKLQQQMKLKEAEVQDSGIEVKTPKVKVPKEKKKPTSII